MKKTMLDATMGLCVGLVLLVGCGATSTPITTPPLVVNGYGYGEAEPAAVAAYQRGWAHILDEGQWTASEDAFREAARLDPDWVMGMAQVARITQDIDEREDLLVKVEAGLAQAPEDSRLILEVFLMNIRAAIARDRGERMPEGFAASRMATAVQNFTQFGERHPGETYIQAERVEWVHAAEGAAAALALMHTLPARVLTAPFYAGYEATLQAELRNMAAAWEAFAQFESMMHAEAPAVAYVQAQLLEAEGNMNGALAAAERAAALDPKHQLAVRLQARLSAELEGE